MDYWDCRRCNFGRQEDMRVRSGRRFDRQKSSAHRHLLTTVQQSFRSAEAVFETPRGCQGLHLRVMMFGKDRLLLYNWTMKSHNYDMQPRAEVLQK